MFGFDEHRDARGSSRHAPPARPPETATLWGCARHAALGKTCCQGRDVLITAGDRSRISAHLRAARAELSVAGATAGTSRSGLSPVAFWEWRSPSDPAYADAGDDPHWLAWSTRADGARPVLRQQAGGDCVFLGRRGCGLPVEVRPLVCRLHPHTYTERGIAGVDGCPAEVVPPGSTLLEVLDMRPADAARWHRMLYDELPATLETLVTLRGHSTECRDRMECGDGMERTRVDALLDVGSTSPRAGSEPLARADATDATHAEVA